MCCKAHNGGTGWGSHQLELDVGRVDAAEHGNLLGGQLRGEHTSPDPRHPSYTRAGRRHLLQHRAWHLDGHTHTPVTIRSRVVTFLNFMIPKRGTK